MEIVDRYDTECIPAPARTNKIAYIQGGGDKVCTRDLKVSSLCINLFFCSLGFDRLLHLLFTLFSPLAFLGAKAYEAACLCLLPA